MIQFLFKCSDYFLNIDEAEQIKHSSNISIFLVMSYYFLSGF